MQSRATTVQRYRSELPPDRHVAIHVIRKAVLANAGALKDDTA